VVGGYVCCDSWVVLFTFGLGWPCVLVVRCLGVVLPCTLFYGVELACPVGYPGVRVA